MATAGDAQGTEFSRNVRQREYAVQHAMRTVEANQQASMQALTARVAASAAAAAAARHAAMISARR